MTSPVTSDLITARHGFFTRAGGVSTGPYASLNCAWSGQDARENIIENRARLARSLGGKPENIVGLTQVHGPDVVTVTEPWLPGNGPRADAAVTTRPGIVLGIVTADCAPVLFADTAAGVIGGAHAGWRGAVAGVLEATIAAMRALGATDIAAVVGPCIAQPSYEVAADMRDEVLAHNPADACFFTDGRPDRWQFDLAGYCAARLRAAGLAQVATTGHDTLALEDQFFSHRRRTLAGGGPIGHQMSAIML